MKLEARFSFELVIDRQSIIEHQILIFSGNLGSFCSIHSKNPNVKLIRTEKASRCVFFERRSGKFPFPFFRGARNRARDTSYSSVVSAELFQFRKCKIRMQRERPGAFICVTFGRDTAARHLDRKAYPWRRKSNRLVVKFAGVAPE